MVLSFGASGRTTSCHLGLCEPGHWPKGQRAGRGPDVSDPAHDPVRHSYERLDPDRLPCARAAT